MKLAIDTQYPAAEKIAITVDAAAAGECALKLRIPAWCDAPALRINGRPSDVKLIAGRYASIRQNLEER